VALQQIKSSRQTDLGNQRAGELLMAIQQPPENHSGEMTFKQTSSTEGDVGNEREQLDPSKCEDEDHH
jgi:hypothetical protein